MASLPTGPRILVVNDEPGGAQSLRADLTQHGYSSIVAASPKEALSVIETERPDLVVLDLVTPGIAGLEACRQIRARSSVPIIVLSVIDREQQKVEALELGADDYVTKPFGQRELIARIGVALRHRIGLASGQTPTYRAGDLLIDIAHHRVVARGEEVQLTPIGYALLRCLSGHAGETVPHSQLLREVWGPGREHDVQSLRFAMFQLRKKLGEDPLHPRYITTMPGIGYRLSATRDEVS